jgi:uncharacterized protein (TIRG00374 family)
MIGLKTLLKLLITGSILYFIWDKFDFSQLQHVFKNPLLLVIVPVCWLLNQLLTTMRLHTFFLALGRPTKFFDVLHANMSSLFVGNLLPGVVGADVVKYFYLKRHDPSIFRSQLALILVLDRIMGLMSVLFWCSFFSVFILFGITTSPPALLIYLPSILLIILIVGLFTVKLIAPYASRLKLPLLVIGLIDTYHQILKLKNSRELTLMMFYNLLAVFILLAGLVFIGGQLQLQQNEESMYILQFFLIPLVLIAAMIPLTPMGIGIAQVTMASAYSLFGLDESIGVTVSTLSQLGLLTISVLVGGGFFLKGKADIAQMRVSPS